MKCTRILCFVFLTFAAASVAAQDQFSLRAEQIRDQLSYLSDSLVTSLNEAADFSVSNTSIQTFLRSVAEVHHLNIQIDPNLNIPITNNFNRVLVKDLLYFLCLEYRLDIHFVGSIMVFTRYQPPPAPLTVKEPKILKAFYDKPSGLATFDLDDDSLRTFVHYITSVSGRNVIVNGTELDGKLLHGYLKDLPLESALEKISYINGLRMTKTKDGVIILESVPPVTSPSIPQQTFTKSIFASNDVVVRDSLIDIDVSNYPIMEIINQVSTQLKVSYVLFSDITGTTSVKVKAINYPTLLSILFQGTAFTFKRKGNVYMFGLRTLEGFRSTEVVKLNFRTIDGIEKEIPSELAKDLEIKVFKELNSLIVSGSKIKIDELASFVRLIDQPVPNIMIEVIVADVKKGYSLQTGISAILGDSVPKTGGSILPGLNMTLSSQTINSALNKLSQGTVNLGKVSPNFYVKLQAQEKNNNIQIRSTPKLSTMNGNKATLTIGESVYYVEQTQNITGGVAPVTTVAQRFNKVEANLQLTISPMVSGNEHITLDVTAEFSSFIPSTITNAPPGNATRKFESKIRVRNEEMIILGGLEELTKSENASGIPLLARIPILKWIFSSRDKGNTDNRLIVFIRPTLVY